MKLSFIIFPLENINKGIQLEGQQQNVGDEGAGDNAEASGINGDERDKLIQQLMQLLHSGDSEECSICLEILQDPVITRYGP